VGGVSKTGTSFQNQVGFPKQRAVSKSVGSSGNCGEFPKLVPVSKTGGSLQNYGQFPKPGSADFPSLPVKWLPSRQKIKRSFLIDPEASPRTLQTITETTNQTADKVSLR
jgi:hypothetical protein